MRERERDKERKETIVKVREREDDEKEKVCWKDRKGKSDGGRERENCETERSRASRF